MEIYLDMDYIIGKITGGHLEGYINFSKEEKEEFQNLLSKDLNDEKLTVEEDEKLDSYKEEILEHCRFVLDDFEIEDTGEYTWKDLLD